MRFSLARHFCDLLSLPFLYWEWDTLTNGNFPYKCKLALQKGTSFCFHNSPVFGVFKKN